MNMLKIMLYTLVFLSLFIPVNSFSQSLRSKYSYVFSDRYDESSKEWKPSKCDCDYESGELHLNPDSTFILRMQQGRLDPEIQHLNGRWEIKNDTVLHLIFAKNCGIYTTGIYYIRCQGLYDGTRTWD